MDYVTYKCELYNSRFAKFDDTLRMEKYHDLVMHAGDVIYPGYDHILGLYWTGWISWVTSHYDDWFIIRIAQKCAKSFFKKRLLHWNGHGTDMFKEVKHISTISIKCNWIFFKKRFVERSASAPHFTYCSHLVNHTKSQWECSIEHSYISLLFPKRHLCSLTQPHHIGRSLRKLSRDGKAHETGMGVCMVLCGISCKGRYHLVRCCRTERNHLVWQ